MRRRTLLFGALSAGLAPMRAGAAAGTIAYVAADGLWTRTLPDGKPARVAGGKPALPRFSATGEWISYCADSGLHVVSRDGKQDRLLGEVDGGTLSDGSQWLPRGDELLADVPGGLRLFTARNAWSGTGRVFRDAGLPVAFSPDGTEIAYGNEIETGRGPGGEPMRTGQLCRIALRRAGDQPRILFSKYLAGMVPCLWTGAGILFWEDPDFSASAVADGLNLYCLPAEGGSPRPLGVTTLVHRDMMSISPGEDRLALSAGGGRNAWEGKRIAVIDLAGGAHLSLTGETTVAVSPAWSPDGRRIAYTAAEGPAAGAVPGGGEAARRLLERRRIWVADATGRQAPVRLTGDERYRDEEPVWLAEGRQILFCRMDRADAKTLWLMDADGSHAVEVAGPLFADPGDLGGNGTWFGYYGYIDWRQMFDWWRAT